MKSGTSYFNGAVYKKTLLRYWPVWAVKLVVWVFAALLTLVETEGLRQYPEGGYRFARNVFILFGKNLPIFAGTGFACVAAMTALSHLYSHKPASFISALPVKREGVFVSCYLAGLTMLVTPIVAAMAILLASPPDNVVLWRAYFITLASGVVIETLQYSLAVLMGMLTGHLAALPVFFAAGNCIAPVCLLAWEALCAGFCLGYNVRVGDSAAWGIAKWLAPLSKLIEMQMSGPTGAVLPENKLVIHGAGALWPYAAAAVLMAAGALLLYRKRRMECAGDVVSVKCMRPVFKYGVAVLAGVFLGALTAAILGLDTDGSVGLIVSILVWAVIGCFTAQMFLDKSLRVFHKWRGPAITAAALLLVILAMVFDVTGYNKRVPKAEDVAFATISGIRTYPSDSGSSFGLTDVSDPADIALVLDVHRAAIAADKGHAEDVDDYSSFYVTYRLKNGGTMRRSYYDIRCSRDDNGPGTFTYAEERLLASRTAVRALYGLEGFDLTAHEDRVQITARVYDADRYDLRPGWDAETMDVEAVPQPVYEDAAFIAGREAKELWDAVIKDFEAGTVGRRFIWGTDYDGALMVHFSFEDAELSKYGDNIQRGSIKIAIPPYAENANRVIEKIRTELELEKENAE